MRKVGKRVFVMDFCFGLVCVLVFWVCWTFYFYYFDNEDDVRKE